MLAGLTDEFVALEILQIINVGLSSLEGLPKLPKLKTVGEGRLSSLAPASVPASTFRASRTAAVPLNGWKGPSFDS